MPGCCVALLFVGSGGQHNGLYHLWFRFTFLLITFLSPSHSSTHSTLRGERQIALCSEFLL